MSNQCTASYKYLPTTTEQEVYLINVGALHLHAFDLSFLFFFDNRFFSGQQFMGNEHICMEILKRNRKQEHELTQPEVE